MLNLINKNIKNCLYFSNKHEKKNPNITYSPKANSNIIPYFDFGNSVEDKKKQLRKKILMLRDNNKHITKFLKQKKVDLVQKLLKKNGENKEKCQKKFESFSEIQNLYNLQTASTEPIPEYFINEQIKSNRSNKIETDKKNFNSIDKNLKRNRSVINYKKKEREDQVSFSDFHLLKDNLIKKDFFNFYNHIKKKRKDHERIFSAKSHSIKEISQNQ